MRAVPALLASFTAFVFPILLVYEEHIDAPDYHRSTGFYRLSRIDQISPDNVPPWVVVVRLDRPSSDAALGFEGQLRRGIEFTPERQIRKSLLSYVWVLMPFVRAQRIQRSDAEDSNYAAEDICLLEIKFNQFIRATFDEVNRFCNVYRFQALG